MVEKSLVLNKTLEISDVLPFLLLNSSMGINI